MTLPALPIACATSHEVHLARQRLYVLSHPSKTADPFPLSRRVRALTLAKSTRDFSAGLLPRAVRALDPAFTQNVGARSASVEACVSTVAPVRRVSTVSSVSKSRAPSLASFAASIGSHATTIRNNMPVYDGASEVLVQARHAPNAFARFTNGVCVAAGTP